jgi:hypothetical protein
MNRASPTTAALSARLQRLVAACLVFYAGCASSTTSINGTWLDSARPRAPLGRTLVVALLRDPKVAAALEREWVRQLRTHGVDATPTDALGPGVRPTSREAVVELVRQHGFASVLVSKLLDVKQAGRDDATSQVAVVENKLYDAHSGEPFWSAQTDTFVAGASGEEVKRPGGDLIQAFVETLIAEMVKAKLL